MEELKLLQAAKDAASNSYSPYSNFKVGAALLTKQGELHLGTNIENASFGAAICAERVAVAKAVSEKQLQLKAIAVIADSKGAVMPCGICRQVLSEFNTELIVICSSFKLLAEKKFQSYSLAELMPSAFTNF